MRGLMRMRIRWIYGEISHRRRMRWPAEEIWRLARQLSPPPCSPPSGRSPASA